VVQATRPPQRGSSTSWSDGTALAPGERLPVAVDDLVRGRYRVERVLAIGALTVIAIAVVEEEAPPSGLHRTADDEETRADPTLPRVALKVMRESRVTPENSMRFMKDAQAMSGLKSRHVPKILDVGMLVSGLPYMVMELLDGQDLETLLERSGVLPAGVAVDYILQVCEALTEAERVGVIHRDLKPADLFLTHDETGAPLLKVLGLGIPKRGLPVAEDKSSDPDDDAAVEAAAAAAGSSPKSLPRPEARADIAEVWRDHRGEIPLLSAPRYKSPEQIRVARDGVEELIDGRSDVWALGAILFELITGHPPFEADTVEELFTKILDKSAPAVEIFLSDPPYGLGAIIHRCLEKDRGKRYVGVGMFALALKELAVRASLSPLSTPLALSGSGWSTAPASHPPASHHPSSPSSPGSAVSRPEPASATAAPPRRARSRLVIFVMLAIVGIGLGLGGVELVARRRSAVAPILPAATTVSSPIAAASSSESTPPALAPSASTSASAAVPTAETSEPPATPSPSTSASGRPKHRHPKPRPPSDPFGPRL
jgi:eukaryotic-like serine/threonine-protein kinase